MSSTVNIRLPFRSARSQITDRRQFYAFPVRNSLREPLAIEELCPRSRASKRGSGQIRPIHFQMSMPLQQPHWGTMREPTTRKWRVEHTEAKSLARRRAMSSSASLHDLRWPTRRMRSTGKQIPLACIFTSTSLGPGSATNCSRWVLRQLSQVFLLARSCACASAVSARFCIRDRQSHTQAELTVGRPIVASQKLGPKRFPDPNGRRKL
jgi:hypothetical protein